MEHLAKQSELSDQLAGLNASLELKQALLAQQPRIGDEIESSSEQDLAALVEALTALEDKLKGVESERDAFHRQVAELRMHSDESGQPSNAAQKKLETLAAEISKLKKQRAQQEALLKARQVSVEQSGRET